MTSTSTSERKRKPEFVTVEEVAKRFRVHKMTVYRMCQSGTLEAYRIGHQVRIKRESVETYVANLTRISDEHQ